MESALSQILGRQVIVVDDCSTDGTRDVLDTFSDRVRILKLPQNQGAIAARNHGADLATGELSGLPRRRRYSDALGTGGVRSTRSRSRSPTLLIAPMLWFSGEPPPKARPEKISFVEYPTYFEKDRGLALSASSTVVQRAAFAGRRQVDSRASSIST